MARYDRYWFTVCWQKHETDADEKPDHCPECGTHIIESKYVSYRQPYELLGSVRESGGKRKARDVTVYSSDALPESSERQVYPMWRKPFEREL